MWLGLTSGVWLNLACIEAIVPMGEGIWRFHPPRFQRGGRPMGRPVQGATSYDEDRGYWEGTPTDEAGMFAWLRREVNSLGR